MGEEKILNDLGRVAQSCWQAIPDYFLHALLDDYVVRPNHVHGMVRITDATKGLVGADNFPPLPASSPTRPTNLPVKHERDRYL